MSLVWAAFDEYKEQGVTDFMAALGEWIMSDANDGEEWARHYGMKVAADILDWNQQRSDNWHKNLVKEIARRRR